MNITRALPICNSCRSTFLRLPSHHAPLSFPGPLRTLTPLRSVSSSAQKLRNRVAPKKGLTKSSPKTPSRSDKHSNVTHRRERQPFRHAEPSVARQPPDIRPLETYRLFMAHVPVWVRNPTTKKKIELFGVKSNHIGDLLSRYERFAKDEISALIKAEQGKQNGGGKLEVASNEDHWSSMLLQAQLTASFSSNLSLKDALEKLITFRFLDWASHQLPSKPGQPPPPPVDNIVSFSPFSHLAEIRKIFDLRRPMDNFIEARSVRRKIIMHVGPTNSGKTYNALVALARAKTGIYAGPLRLLAHEVWERLNKGLIVAPPNPDGTPGKSLKRECNMRTGEESRIVSPTAPLLSATVEMVSYTEKYDVAVIDEIQMLGDPARGGAWTNALLGIRANELHVCGETTVVDLVKSIAADLGDEFELHEYKRLTPLEVSKSSLNGDWKSVRKGDCVVAFSRSNIFAIKRLIESSTGLRCAVVYGGLPPEVRSEQAALFNDPDSGYDVMVASDAIGMGLNLKIKRVIFHTLEKFNGVNNISLSVSAIKQIGGRAGRFGLHEDNTSAGQVTTFRPLDLAKLRRSMLVNTPNITRANVEPSQHINLKSLLVKGTPFPVIHRLVNQLTVLNRPYALSHDPDIEHNLSFMKQNTRNLLPEEDYLVYRLPVPLKDSYIRLAAANMVRQFSNNVSVDLFKSFDGTPFLSTLERIRAIRQDFQEKNWTQRKKQAVANDLLSMDSNALWALESCHRISSAYLWMANRSPPAFYQYDRALETKTELEEILQFCLDLIAELLADKRRKRGQVRSNAPQPDGLGEKPKDEYFWEEASGVGDGIDLSRSEEILELLSKGAKA
ncbi:RNA helicase [Tulasnella sp. 418]|nr:RNA helicase [Tulasnella sp. 418]